MQKLFIGLLSIFVLASCTPSESGSVPAPIQKNDYQTELQTASSKIKATKEFADCMEPAVSMCVNSVGMQLAQKEKSTDFCSELSGKDQQDGCKFAVIMSIASEKNDPSLCSTLSEGYVVQCKSAIYSSQAVNAKDPSLCDKIDEGSVSANTSGSSIPAKKGGPKDQCIFSVLISKETATVQDCKSIQDPSLQNTCITSLKTRVHQSKSPINK